MIRVQSADCQCGFCFWKIFINSGCKWRIGLGQDRGPLLWREMNKTFGGYVGLLRPTRNLRSSQTHD
jgi:hypothetical protein